MAGLASGLFRLHGNGGPRSRSSDRVPRLHHVGNLDIDIETGVDVKGPTIQTVAIRQFVRWKRPAEVRRQPCCSGSIPAG